MNCLLLGETVCKQGIRYVTVEDPGSCTGLYAPKKHKKALKKKSGNP